MAYFEVFGWYWTFQYINAIVICTIGCAVGIYYFTPLIKGNRVLYNIIQNIQIDTPVWKSFLTAIYFHSGSLLLGSFFISIYQLLRYFISYINKLIKKGEKNNDCLSNLCISCLKLCICCCGEVMMYVSTCSYIIVGIEGRGLFDSFSRTQSLLVSSLPTVGILNGLSVILTILDKILISSLYINL